MLSNIERCAVSLRQLKLPLQKKEMKGANKCVFVAGDCQQAARQMRLYSCQQR